MTSTTLTNIRLAPNIYLSPITDDGCIILDFGQDKVLSLNKTGAVILHRIVSSASGLSRAELVSAASLELDLDQAIVDDLIGKLSEKRLLQSSARPARSGIRWLRELMVRGAANGNRFLIDVLLQLKLYLPAALMALIMVDLALKLTGINALRRMVSDWPIGGRAPDSGMITSLCSAVTRAGIWYSKKTLCLQRSAATTCLLRSLGAPAEMVIGVHKMPFYGHAWVEIHSQVVNDHPKVQTFFQVLSRC